MPHKHKRRTDDKSFFDLPPTSRAKPLPTKITANDPAKSKKKRKRAEADNDDDTPKSFARLMRFQAGQPLPKGLDNGERKKRKRAPIASDTQNRDQNPTTPTSPQKPENKDADKSQLRIQPNERLSDFAARVDQALPLSSLASLNSKKASGPVDPSLKGIMKERPTKHNKRLGRMQKEWREEEAKRKDRLEAEMEEAEELREREGLLWQQQQQEEGQRKKNKNGRKKGQGQKRGDDDDEDPWAELTRRKREATRQRGLLDVVQAPPQLDLSKARGKGRIFREVNAVVDVENVPSSVGSLRKREEMAGKRREVIDGYRKKMIAKSERLNA